MFVTFLVQASGFFSQTEPEQPKSKFDPKIYDYVAKREKSGSIGLFMGFNFPLGEFKEKDANNEKAGLALPGYHYGLEASYLLFEQFGVAVAYHAQSNKTDGDAIERELARQFFGVYWTVESGNWSQQGFFAGPHISLPTEIKKKFCADFRLLFGFVDCRSPSVNVSAQFGTSVVSSVQSSGNARSFSFMLGSGFRYNISRDFALVFSGSYVTANPEFTDVKVTYSNSTQPDTVDFSQLAETLNFSISFLVRFP